MGERTPVRGRLRRSDCSGEAAIERVAEALGNTPAVCRSSYVDPRVLARSLP